MLMSPNNISGSAEVRKQAALMTLGEIDAILNWTQSIAVGIYTEPSRPPSRNANAAKRPWHAMLRAIECTAERIEADFGGARIFITAWSRCRSTNVATNGLE